MLNISRTQVYRLMRRNVLVKVIVGDKIMVMKDSVERYLQLKFQVDQLREEMLKPFPV